MDWNEFNRELQQRVSDPGMRYILGLIYERVLDMAKQQDMVGEVCLQMAETLDGIVKMNDIMDSRIRTLRKHITGEHEGIDLRSVPLTNEER